MKIKSVGKIKKEHKYWESSVSPKNVESERKNRRDFLIFEYNKKRALALKSIPEFKIGDKVVYDRTGETGTVIGGVDDSYEVQFSSKNVKWLKLADLRWNKDED